MARFSQFSILGQMGFQILLKVLGSNLLGLSVGFSWKLFHCLYNCCFNYYVFDVLFLRLKQFPTFFHILESRVSLFSNYGEIIISTSILYFSYFCGIVLVLNLVYVSISCLNLSWVWLRFCDLYRNLNK